MNPSDTIALIAVTRRGVEQARRLRQRLRAGTLYRPARYGAPLKPWEHLLDKPLAKEVPALFARSQQLVFFLAAGAAVRLIAPCLASKSSDPGVLAVDEASRFVIPLLSGHKGGANAFARTVAGCLGAVPAITTASDAIGALSLDLLEDAFGWSAEPAQRVKAAALALVNGEPVAVIQETGSRGCWLDETELPENVSLARAAGSLPKKEFASVLWVADRVVDDVGEIGQERILWYRPKSLVLGVGCERGVSQEALEDGLEQFLAEHRFARSSIGILATVDLKADEEGLVGWARQNGWRSVFYPVEALAGVANVPRPSRIVEKCIGAPGVAEPAALLAAKAERLLVEKQILTSSHSPRRMTFALARLSHYEDARDKKGKVVFIGAGPGDPELLTLKARRILQKADVVIYAGSLIPEAVLQHAGATAELHDSAPLTLEETLAVMTRAACRGRTVARLQSGDTSLYSAIREQMALLDEAGVDYEVVPGISAFQAAAAALRTELTLPEAVQTVILTRGQGKTPMPRLESLEKLARHRATLCIYLSARLGEKVQKQLLRSYPKHTPVAILYRVSWPDEKIIVTQLANLGSEIRKHHLTRTTLILVGEAVSSERSTRAQKEKTKKTLARSRLYDPGHGHIFRRRSSNVE